jgi:polyphenol oxidase
MQKLLRKNLDHGFFETWNARPEFELVEVRQVHGHHIACKDEIPCDADGIVVSWNELDQALAIKTADCLAIIIEGEKGCVLLHAGWRGLAQGILASNKIKEILPLNAYIGPSIQVCCFEVSAEFKEHFPQSKNFNQREGRIFFNLQNEARDQLLLEFSNIQVEIDPTCTCCDSDFHSYRRDKTINRNWNIYIKG